MIELQLTPDQASYLMGLSGIVGALLISYGIISAL